MSEPIDLEERRRLLDRFRGTDDMQYEKFLLEEGLELLANYRAIPNFDARRAIRALISRLAESSYATGSRSST